MVAGVFYGLSYGLSARVVHCIPSAYCGPRGGSVVDGARAGVRRLLDCFHRTAGKGEGRKAMKLSMSADVAELGELHSDSAPIRLASSGRGPVDLAPDAGAVAGVPTPLTRRAARRFVIRLIGFASLGALVWGAVYIAREPRARGEIASWGTMGNPRIAATAGRGMRSMVETVRSFGK